MNMMKGEDDEDQRLQVAPNMVAGGSYPQAAPDLEEEEATEVEQHKPEEEHQKDWWNEPSAS